MSFDQRKKDILSKTDKSFKGKWDEKIKPLCDKINSFENYYTTSSCSGRTVIIADQEKKAPNLFEFMCHYPIAFDEMDDHIPTKGNFKFKQEPMILHIACRDLESASEMLNKIRDVGLKKVGIISLGKNIIIEVVGTEKMEFPLVKDGKLLADKEFLYEIFDRSGENLEKNWKRIEKLRKSL